MGNPLWLREYTLGTLPLHAPLNRRHAKVILYMYMYAIHANVVYGRDVRGGHTGS